MRIAPKPLKGQEIRLDQLLGEAVKPKKKSDEWTMGPVTTRQGPVSITLSTILMPNNTRDDLIQLLNQAGFPYRLISADELYAIMDFMYQGELRWGNAPITQRAAFLKAQFLVDASLMLHTELVFKPDNEAFVAYHSDTKHAHYTQFPREQFFADPEKLSLTVFNAPDPKMFSLTWAYFTGHTPCYRAFKSKNDPADTYQIRLDGSAITFHHDTESEGLGILVKTTPVTP